MGTSRLKGARMLAVDDEPDVLDILKDELDRHGVALDRASSYEEALQRLHSFTYDLAIFDIMGVQGFDLLEFARSRGVPAVMLTAHALSPEALKRSIELGARAYIPKDEIENVVPFLESVLTLSYRGAWKNLFESLGSSFGKSFGPYWRRSEKEFWEKFEDDLEVKEPTIIK